MNYQRIGTTVRINALLSLFIVLFLVIYVHISINIMQASHYGAKSQMKLLVLSSLNQTNKINSAVQSASCAHNSAEHLINALRSLGRRSEGAERELSFCAHNARPPRIVSLNQMRAESIDCCRQFNFTAARPPFPLGMKISKRYAHATSIRRIQIKAPT